MDRPSPDELLARANEEARRETRGRLKIFFGASPGVGKTFAMLEAAWRQKQAGIDVVVGVVETHKRAETAALLEGLDVLPRRAIAHRKVMLDEFDLDAALARRPGLLLVDELAHTNAPGSRHVKRWQDVLELVEAGIDVYSTLNVQHVDSLNDVVAQITGVIVRETVPDSVLDQADEIELIDLPVNELTARLEAGKVYLPEQAARATHSFFRPGNLIALRELALRRTADRVDAQMRDYRRDNSIQSTWPVTGRIIVCIGPSPFAATLVRAAKRMAEQLNSEWIVAFVETPGYASLPPQTRERVLGALRLAEQLGAETVTLTGTGVAEAILRYARSKNVTKVVIGKQAGPLWRRLLRGSVLDDLIERSGDIEVYAIGGGAVVEAAGPIPAPSVASGEYAWAAGFVAVATAVALLFRDLLAPANLVMFYLLAVVAVSLRSSRRVALLSAFLSVAAFDFFCVPPYLTFAVSDYEYLVTFAVMLAVGIVISNLATRTRRQAEHAVDREARTQALYQLTRELGGATRAFDAARIATGITSDLFGVKVVIFLPDEPGKISFRRRTTDDLPVPQSEEGIAQWVFDHGQNAGRGLDTLPGATAIYLPLRAARQTLGVMAVLPQAPFSPEQQHLLEIFASQTALAMDRAMIAADARDAELRAETEQMRSSLLSAVSHDLRTPLASITGAASSLLEQGDRFDPATRRDLLESIQEEAARLSRLVNNLLDMTRLESGAVVVKREWHPLEEIVGAALGRLEHALAGREVRTDLPPQLPMIAVDDVLLEQVFINLLENVAKYTPAGSPVEIAARRDADAVIVEVRDRGPGFAAGDAGRIFEKFYRGAAAEAGRGAGLGLAICRAVVRAHQGEIEALERPGGGAIMRVRLPIGGKPPEAPAGD